MYDFADFSDRFSESGQRVMKLAVEEARRREHNFIAPEHIFASILDVERSFFNEIMQSLNVDPQVVINELDTRLAIPKQYSGKRIKLADSTKDLLTASLRRARQSGRHTIDAIDFFQVLFEDRNSTPVIILRKFGIEPDLVVAKIVTAVHSQLRRKYEFLLNRQTVEVNSYVASESMKEPINQTSFPTNSLFQLYLAIPLSIVGKMNEKVALEIWKDINWKGLVKYEEDIKYLETLFFQTFNEVLDLFETKNYGRIWEKIEYLRKALKSNKETIERLLRIPKESNSFFIDNLENKAKEFFQTIIISLLNNEESIDEEITISIEEIIIGIASDLYFLYGTRVFEFLTQRKEIWTVCRQYTDTANTSQLILKIYSNLSKVNENRNIFEMVRSYILRQEKDLTQMEIEKERYLDYLTRKCALIELKGVSPRVQGQDISFKLEEIFIPVGIKKEKEEDYNRRSYSGKYEELLKDTNISRHEKSVLLEKLERYPRIVLLGDPGGGKSTFIKYVVLQVCKFYKSGKFLPFYVPIILKVSDYARSLKYDPKKTLIDFICNQYGTQYNELLKWLLENRQALLLLDGLDEVLDTSQRLKIVAEVEDLVAQMPENRYIITSRIIGYSEARFGNEFAEFLIQPFSTEQIKIFCKAWYKAVAKNSLQDKKQALEEANKLYKAITKKTEVQKLACNPLLMTLIANIHFKGQSLPHNRVQLYDIAIETLLQYWVQGRVDEQSSLRDKDDIINLLSPIAFYIHKHNPEGVIEESDFDRQCRNLLEGKEYSFETKKAKQEIKEIKEFLRQQTGFFHEKGMDETSGQRFFGFLHQTFQEYLTAIAITNQWEEEKLDLGKLIGNVRWVEALRLTAGILSMRKGSSGKRSVTKFVEDILKCSQANKTETSQRILLVSLILSDNIDLIPENQEKYFDAFLEDWSKGEDTNLLGEYNKSVGLLLESNHKENVYKKIIAILEMFYHPLQEKIAHTLIQNENLISQSKNYILKFLKSNNVKVAENFWKAFGEYVSIQDSNLYWEISQYGDPYQIQHDPAGILHNFISYEKFLTIVGDISQQIFLLVFDTIKNMLNSYIYLYKTWWSFPFGGHIKVLVDEGINSKSTRFRTLILALLQNNDLKEFKDEIIKMLDETTETDELFNKYASIINAKINE